MPGFPARRHRSTRGLRPRWRPRRRQGRVPDQRRGPRPLAVGGHAVRVRRRRRGDLRTLPGAGARRPARPVPVRRRRLPRRQRVAQRRAGSEYINHTVAALLNKLHVRDFTKSRPRRSTDNALVEGKNANVVRRFLGHDHIPPALRAARRRVRPGAPVAVPQLPPALPVRHRARGRQRPRAPRPTGPPTSKPPTTSCAPCPTPKPASSPASRSRNSTSKPTRTATCTPPGPSTPSATGSSGPSPTPGPRSREPQNPHVPAPRFPPPAHRRCTD